MAAALCHQPTHESLLPLAGEGARQAEGEQQTRPIGASLSPQGRNTPHLSSLRKQGPNSKPALLGMWIPACGGMTASWARKSQRTYPRAPGPCDSLPSPAGRRCATNVRWGISRAIGVVRWRGKPGRSRLHAIVHDQAEPGVRPNSDLDRPAGRKSRSIAD